MVVISEPKGFWILKDTFLGWTLAEIPVLRSGKILILKHFKFLLLSFSLQIPSPATHILWAVDPVGSSQYIFPSIIYWTKARKNSKWQEKKFWILFILLRKKNKEKRIKKNKTNKNDCNKVKISLRQPHIRAGCSKELIPVQNIPPLNFYVSFYWQRLRVCSNYIIERKIKILNFYFLLYFRIHDLWSNTWK